MFTNLRITIFIYYIISVCAFLSFAYYVTAVLKIENTYFVILVIASFIILSGILIAQLAVDPLKEYATNLQSLSKETLHELNLPISTIVANIQMLQKNINNPKNLKRLQRVNLACEMLQQRYNELEYMIKMQTQEELQEKFFLDELVQTRVDFLQRIYPKMNFILTLDKVEILTDKIGLSKVVDNIIDNAVKYSVDSKNVNISLKNKILNIEDFGIGMDEVEIIKIFDNFYQSNVTMQGFGIGLNMVKRFCDANNIILRFKSSPNVGTLVQLKFKNI